MKRRLQNIAMAVAAILLLSSCGGSASAPPIDLPAPITGRIDVSDSDSDGYVTIMGEAGSVDGSSTVMAVNETVAGTQSKLLEALVRSAHAQASLPALCSEAGRACTVAAEDGSFTIRIAATEDDPLVIGLVDPTSGSFISGLLRRGVNSKANCAGLGLAGRMIDIGLIPAEGTPILLFEGSDEMTNRLVVGTDDPKTVYLPGCYAQDLAVRTDEGVTAVAVVSSNDRILWRGLYAGSLLFSKMKHIVLANAPRRISYGRNPLVALIVYVDFENATFDRISLVDGSLIPPVGPPLPDSLEPATLVCHRLDAIAMNNGDPLVLALVDHGEGTASSLLFIDMPRMIIKGLWTSDTWGNVDRSLRDCTIHANAAGALFIACAGRNAQDGEFVEVTALMTIGGGANDVPLTLTAALADVTSILRGNSVIFRNLSSAPLRATASGVIAAGAAGVNADFGTPLASTNDSLFLFDPLTSALASTVPISADGGIIAIALDEASKSFFAADANSSSAVSLGSQLTWTN